MPESARLPLAWRLAVRELRGSLGSFRIFLACLALGVAAVAAVGQLSASLEAGLRRDARTLLGGDFAVQQSYTPLAADVLAELQAGGVVAPSARMRCMAVAGEGAASLVELKAVSGAYPLYGRFEIQGGGDLAQALAGKDGAFGAVVEAGLLSRLNRNIGDIFHIGEAAFRITGVIAREPDRAAGVFGLGPRVVVSLEGFAATGLEKPGSLVYWTYAVRTDTPAAAERLKAGLRQRWTEPQWRIRDTSSATGGVMRFIDNLSLYLTLVGLISLLLGGVGASGGVRNFLETRLETVAVLKCLGADRRSVVTVFLIQVLILALAGIAAGLILGAGAAWLAGDRLARNLGMSVAQGLYAAPLLTAAAFGLLTALVFSALPLARAVNVSPARLFRGYADAAETRTPLRAWLAAGLGGAAMLVLALLTAKRWPMVLGFAAGVLLTAGLFRLFAGLIRRAAARLPRPRNPRLAHALANIHRVGSPAASIIVSLGFGLSALAAVALIHGNMRAQIEARIPKVAPLYFLLDIRPDDLSAVRSGLTSLPGAGPFEAQPSVRGRVLRINGHDIDERKVDPDVRWVVQGDRGLTFMGDPPPNLLLKKGSWWPKNYSGPPLICLDDKVAEGFGLGLGDTLTVNVLGREVTGRIAATREIDWSTLALNHVIIFSPGVLEEAPHTYIATIAGDPGAAGPMLRFLSTRYPEVGAVYVRDVLADVSALMGRVALALGAVSAFTLVVGLLVLSESLRADLRARHHDAVVFKVLGATRRDILAIFLLEFAMLGAVTATLAGAIGSVAAFVFIKLVVHGEWVFLPTHLAAILAGGAGVTIFLGLAGVRGVLARDSWTVLRNE